MWLRSPSAWAAATLAGAPAVALWISRAASRVAGARVPRIARRYRERPGAGAGIAGVLLIACSFVYNRRRAPLASPHMTAGASKTHRSHRRRQPKSRKQARLGEEKVVQAGDLRASQGQHLEGHRPV